MKQAVLKSHNTLRQCTGCLACLDSCNHGAIQSRIDDRGHIVPLFDKNRCIDCGRCDAVCPVIAVETISVNDSQPYAAWSLNNEIRKDSASGGIFSALALKVINEGGYVSGAIIKGCVVKHIVTNNIEVIKEIQGSKYQQGHLDGVYREIKERLKEGKKVLFSGAPCQVAAIKKFFKHSRFADNLITVDFFCGGFPSIFPLESFKKNCGFEIKRIISFRNKDNGWKAVGYRYCFQVEDAYGQLHSFGDNNIVSKAFISHLTNRDSCLNCKFATPNRSSDITIGDYWGCKNYLEQEELGISVVVVHNQQMIDLLESAGIVLNPIKWKDFVMNNPRAVIGKFYGFHLHWVNRWYSYLFKKLSYKTICALFGVGPLSYGMKMNNLLYRVIKKADKTIKKYRIKQILKRLDK